MKVPYDLPGSGTVLIHERERVIEIEVCAVNRKAEVGDNVACRPDGLCKNIFCDRIDVSF